MSGNPTELILPEDTMLVDMRAGLAEVEKRIHELEIAADQEQLRHYLYDFKPLPTQQRYLDAINSGKAHVVLLTAGNKLGKTWVQVYDLISESLGYQPHDGTPRPRNGYDIALLVTDYDSAGMKIYREGFLRMMPDECVKVVSRTQSGAPRIIMPIDPLTYVEGCHIHIFTHDQEAKRTESGSWKRVGIDEPPPQRHFEGLIRGLQTTGGLCTMTMTLLEGSAWVWDRIHMDAGNQGGKNKRYFSFCCHPDENKASKGGHIPDQAVDDFRASIPRELWDARVLGKALHLTGRVYKNFDADVHVLQKPLHTEEEIETFPKVLCIDPHERLPWAMVWAYVAPGDMLVVYDEWPKRPLDDFTHTAFTLSDYVDIIDKHDVPTWALMDPNFGRTVNRHSGMMLFQEMTLETGLPFTTDIDDDVTSGHLAVSERLSYDTSQPLSTLNQPKIYFQKNCRNTIRAFQNYIWQEWRGKTAEGRDPNPKPQEKEKHWCDDVRYICQYPPIKFRSLVRERKHVFKRAPRSARIQGRRRVKVAI